MLFFSFCVLLVFPYLKAAATTPIPFKNQLTFHQALQCTDLSPWHRLSCPGPSNDSPSQGPATDNLGATPCFLQGSATMAHTLLWFSEHVMSIIDRVTSLSSI